MKLIVLLHGYGASGHDLQNLSVPWAGAGRSFTALNAPDLCAGMGPGYEWFTLNGWMPGTSFDAFTPRIVDAATQLKTRLKAELEKRALVWSDLILMGFSQGAIMSFAVGLSEETPCAGIMGYSGAYMVPDSPACKPPVLIVHGGSDMVVSPSAHHASVEKLEEHGIETMSVFVPSCGHWIDPVGLTAGGDFLRRIA